MSALNDATKTAEKISKLSPQGLQNIVVISALIAGIAFTGHQSLVQIPRIIDLHHTNVQNLIDAHHEDINKILDAHRKDVDEITARLDKLDVDAAKILEHVRNR